MLNKITHPTLVAKDIMLRTNKDENTEEIEKFVGKSYPLIRILDRTVDQLDIRNFSYRIGSDLLPEINLALEDESMRWREALKTNLDTITVYISNNIDGTFSKQEYIISNMSSSPDDPSVTITAMLYVPEFFKRSQRFLTGTSVDALKTICTEVGLGLATNITPADDMTRIQDNCTNLDFIRNIIATADNQAVHCFIDQWSYLNFVDVRKAIETEDEMIFDYDPYSGEALDEPQKLVLSNKYIDSKRVGKIIVWAANDDYGLKSLAYVSSYDIENFDLVNLEKNGGSKIEAMAEELRDGKRKIAPQSDNVWEGYFRSKYYGDYLLKTIHQSTEMAVRLQYPIHALSPSLNLPVEIYNTQKRGNYYDQTDPSKTFEDMPQNTDEGSRELVKNELYSGNYYLHSIEMRYVDNLIEQRLYMRQI